MDITVPSLSEDVIRMAALQMATMFADDAQHALHLADEFVNYIDNGGGTVRVECSERAAKIV